MTNFRVENPPPDSVLLQQLVDAAPDSVLLSEVWNLFLTLSCDLACSCCSGVWFSLLFLCKNAHCFVVILICLCHWLQKVLDYHCHHCHHYCHSFVYHLLVLSLLWLTIPLCLGLPRPLPLDDPGLLISLSLSPGLSLSCLCLTVPLPRPLPHPLDDPSLLSLSISFSCSIWSAHGILPSHDCDSGMLGNSSSDECIYWTIIWKIYFTNIKKKNYFWKNEKNLVSNSFKFYFHNREWERKICFSSATKREGFKKKKIM